METKESIQRDEAFSTQWELNKDDARDECMDKVNDILMEVEHMVDDNDNSVDLINVMPLSRAILEAKNLRYFDFSAIVYGKYNDYEETYSFIFQMIKIITILYNGGYSHNDLHMINILLSIIKKFHIMVIN